MKTARAETFSGWRQLARGLFYQGVPPDEVLWATPGQELLFDEPPAAVPRESRFNVPREFVSLATRASMHRSEDRWSLLYRLLWRLTHESRTLLEQTSDGDVVRLHQLDGEVRRDCHKMKAFVRFRKSGQGDYVAWHEPSHLVVKAVAPFFARRFNTMTWSILTPDCSAYWNQETLKFGPGLPRSQAPTGDQLEELWKTYYANIFNPSRVKISAMVSEMPKKYWHTMPETAIISELLREAPQRMQTMIESAARSSPLPQELVDTDSLEELKARALDCQGCDLCHSATQTVFGEGATDPRVVFVGEQPGDNEDRAGRPFVGPAGQLLRRCLKQLEVNPEAVYFTNVVKHFRWEPSPRGGKKRLHKRATWRQIEVCKPWVQQEIKLLEPDLVVLLGATALQALVGRQYSIGACRGQRLPSELAPQVIATVHPSSLLRIQEAGEKSVAIERFCLELRQALATIGKGPSL